MISSSAFNALNLSQFCILEMVEHVSDYEYLDTYWRGEVFGFSASLQSENDETVKCLMLDLSNAKDTLGGRVLQAVALGVARGSDLDQLTALLGRPVSQQQFVKDRTTYEFSTRFDVPYSISCTVHKSKGLIFISIVNA